MAASNRIPVEKSPAEKAEIFAKKMDKIHEHLRAYETPEALTLLLEIKEEECNEKQKIRLKRSLSRCYSHRRQTECSIPLREWLIVHGEPDDKSASSYWRLGLAYEKQKELKKAEECFRKYFTDPKCHISLLRLLDRCGKFDESRKIIEDYLRVGRPSEEVFISHARSYQAQERFEQAEEILLKLPKTSYDVTVALAKLYRASGEIIKSEDLFAAAEKIIEVEIKSPTPDIKGYIPESTNEVIRLKTKHLMLLGDRYKMSRRFEEALECYSQTKKLSPTYFRASRETALCLRRLGRFDEAEAIYSDPEFQENAEMQSHYASMLAHLGRNDEATDIDTNLLFADNLSLKIDQAHRLRHKGQIVEAIDLLRKINKPLDHIQIVIDLMIFLSEAHQFDQALEVYNRYAGPRTLKLELKRINCLVKMGSYEEAYLAYGKILETTPITSEMALEIIYLLELRGEIEEAERIFLHPDLSQRTLIRMGYARFLYAKGRHDESLELLDLLAESIDVVCLKAKCMLKLNEHVSADKLMAAELAKNPRDLGMRFEYARYCEEKGDIKLAKERYKEVLNESSYLEYVEAYAKFLINIKSPEAKTFLLDRINKESVPSLHLLLVNFYIKTNSLGAASKASAQLVKEFPGFIQGYEISTQVMHRQMRYTAVINSAQRYIYGDGDVAVAPEIMEEKRRDKSIISIHFSRSTRLYYSKMKALLHVGQVDSAHKLYQECSEKFAGHYLFLSDLKGLFLSTNNLLPFNCDRAQEALPRLYDLIDTSYEMLPELKREAKYVLSKRPVPGLDGALTVFSAPISTMPSENETIVALINEAKLEPVANVPLNEFCPPDVLEYLQSFAREFVFFIVGGVPRDLLLKGFIGKADFDGFVLVKDKKKVEKVEDKREVEEVEDKRGGVKGVEDKRDVRKVAKYLKTFANKNNPNLFRIKFSVNEGATLVLDIFCSNASTILADTMRRDAYINTLLIDVHNGNVYDPSGRAIPDICSNTLTPIIDLDTLHMQGTDAQICLMRFIYLSARGIQLSLDTKNKIKAAAVVVIPALLKQCPQRVIDFLHKMTTGGCCAASMRLLREVEMFNLLFPTHLKTKEEEIIDFDRLLTKCVEIDSLEEDERYRQKKFTLAVIIASRVNRAAANIEVEVEQRLIACAAIIPSSIDPEELFEKVLEALNLFGVQVLRSGHIRFNPAPGMLERKSAATKGWVPPEIRAITSENATAMCAKLFNRNLNARAIDHLFEKLSNLIDKKTSPKSLNSGILDLVYLAFSRLKRLDVWLESDEENAVTPVTISYILHSVWNLSEYMRIPIDKDVVSRLVNKFLSLPKKYELKVLSGILQGLCKMNHPDIDQFKKLFKILPELIVKDIADGEKVACQILQTIAYCIFQLGETVDSLEIASCMRKLYEMGQSTQPSSRSHKLIHNGLAIKLKHAGFANTFRSEKFFFGTYIDDYVELPYLKGRSQEVIKIAIEYDGPHHFDEDGHLFSADIWRQALLEKAGIHVIRINLLEVGELSPTKVGKIVNDLYVQIQEIANQHNIDLITRETKPKPDLVDPKLLQRVEDRKAKAEIAADNREKYIAKVEERNQEDIDREREETIRKNESEKKAVEIAKKLFLTRDWSAKISAAKAQQKRIEDVLNAISLDAKSKKRERKPMVRDKKHEAEMRNTVADLKLAIKAFTLQLEKETVELAALRSEPPVPPIIGAAAPPAPRVETVGAAAPPGELYYTPDKFEHAAQNAYRHIYNAHKQGMTETFIALVASFPEEAKVFNGKLKDMLEDNLNDIPGYWLTPLIVCPGKHPEFWVMELPDEEEIVALLKRNLEVATRSMASKLIISALLKKKEKCLDFLRTAFPKTVEILRNCGYAIPQPRPVAPLTDARHLPLVATPPALRAEVAELRAGAAAPPAPRAEVVEPRAETAAAAPSIPPAAPASSYTPAFFASLEISKLISANKVSEVRDQLNKLKEKCDVRDIKCNSGYSLLYYVRHIEMANCLINEFKFDVNVPIDKHGNRFLYRLAYMDNLPLIRHLVTEAKANVKSVNQENVTAFCIALVNYSSYKDLETIRFFVDFYKNSAEGRFFNDYIRYILLNPPSDIGDGINNIKILVEDILTRNIQAAQEIEEDSRDNVLHIIAANGSIDNPMLSKILIDIISKKNPAALTQLNARGETPEASAQRLNNITAKNRFALVKKLLFPMPAAPHESAPKKSHKRR